MQLHELLAETARRFRDGTYQWAQFAMAYKANPLDASEPVRDTIVTEPNDPEAICFCALGGLVRTHGAIGDWNLAEKLSEEYPGINKLLARACDFRTPADDRYWPVVDFNDHHTTSRDDVIAMLERAAALATPPCPED